MVENPQNGTNNNEFSLGIWDQVTMLDIVDHLADCVVYSYFQTTIKPRLQERESSSLSEYFRLGLTV